MPRFNNFLVHWPSSCTARDKKSCASRKLLSRRCAVPAASVVLENVVAFEIAAALVDKFGGDSVEEMLARWKLFQQMAAKR